jgi:hypothetical protein
VLFGARFFVDINTFSLPSLSDPLPLHAQLTSTQKTLTCDCNRAFPALRQDYVLLHWQSGEHDQMMRSAAARTQRIEELSAHIAKDKAALVARRQTAALQGVDTVDAPSGLASLPEGVLAERLLTLEYFAVTGMPLHRLAEYKAYHSALLHHRMPDDDQYRQLIPVLLGKWKNTIKTEVKVGKVLGVAFDGTTRFAHLVGVIFRTVDANLQPLQRCVAVEMLKRAYTGPELARLLFNL